MFFEENLTKEEEELSAELESLELELFELVAGR